MKQIQEPIQVQHRYAPWEVRWRGQTLTVEEIVESWSWRGRWWLDPQLQGERRRYYRVLCHASGRQARRVMEIFRRQRNGSHHWILSRIVD